jgi:hypothetical protein
MGLPLRKFDSRNCCHIIEFMYLYKTDLTVCLNCHKFYHSLAWFDVFLISIVLKFETLTFSKIKKG